MSLQVLVQTAISNVLSIEELDIVHDQSSTLVGLKRECLFTLDALSAKSSLWNVITMESVPHISQYLKFLLERQGRCAMPCFGPPLILYKGSCFKFSSPLYSTISTFFLIASLCNEKIEGKAFWDTVMLKNSSKLNIFTLLHYLMFVSNFWMDYYQI